MTRRISVSQPRRHRPLLPVAVLLPALTALLLMAGAAAAGPARAEPSVDSLLAQIAEQDPRGGEDLLAAMLGDDARGTADGVPLSHYDLGADTGGLVSLDRVQTVQARLLFSAGRWAIGVADFLLGWVLRFEVGAILVGRVAQIARSLDHGLVEGLELGHLALLAAVARSAWLLLRQRTHAGMSELLVALLIAGIGGAMIRTVEDTTCRGMQALAATTIAILELGMGREPADEPPGDCTDMFPDGVPGVEFSSGVARTFVVEPHQLLQWGSRPTGPCERIAEALVAHGPWADDGYPREVMGQLEACAHHAAFNETMGADRLVGAFAFMLASTAFAVAVVMVVGTLLVAQVGGALLVVLMPFAWVVGIAPGTGRELLGRWYHAVLKVAVLFIGSAFFLTMLVAVVEELQRLEDQPVAVRAGLVAAGAWTLVLLRRQGFAVLRAGAHGVAARAAGPDADVGGVGRSPGAAVRGLGGAAVRVLGGRAVAALARGGDVAGGGPSQGVARRQVVGADRAHGRVAAGRGSQLLLAHVRTTASTVSTASAVSTASLSAASTVSSAAARSATVRGGSHAERSHAGGGPVARGPMPLGPVRPQLLPSTAPPVGRPQVRSAGPVTGSGALTGSAATAAAGVHSTATVAVQLPPAPRGGRRPRADRRPPPLGRSAGTALAWTSNASPTSATTVRLLPARRGMDLDGLGVEVALADAFTPAPPAAGQSDASDPVVPSGRAARRSRLRAPAHVRRLATPRLRSTAPGGPRP